MIQARLNSNVRISTVNEGDFFYDPEINLKVYQRCEKLESKLEAPASYPVVQKKSQGS